ncbi:4-hydroxy-3-methylbut-2-enyl diphosphate reductase [Candidatus Acetothermia bacterium]|nr:MAG: 4-hydroxy-3-methylbut-2-enyl diphosphate reductase [Candidatus Acetothermia bacterium]
MRIVRADVLGFCFGVNRAVEMIETETREHGPLYTLGAIVHNAHVVETLAEKGAKLVHSLDEVPDGGTVAITAHGAGEEVYAEIRRRGLRLVDTTCTIVRRAQQTAAKLVDEGYFVVVYGEADHPEVKGILSWTRGKGIATLTPDVDLPPEASRIGIIAQTTKKPELFARFAQELTERYAEALGEIRAIDTTCPETGRRYQAARELAAKVDLLIVVGSRFSANTRKLAETCRGTGVPTYHIEFADEIDPGWLSGIGRVGVTAGASTPDSVIEAVVHRLSELGGEREDESTGGKRG